MIDPTVLPFEAVSVSLSQVEIGRRLHTRDATVGLRDVHQASSLASHHAFDAGFHASEFGDVARDGRIGP
jgi:hypothetical protein